MTVIKIVTMLMCSCVEMQSKTRATCDKSALLSQ